jgi:hypothetical protein
MGDLITSGIAIGFAAGVTAALIARRIPLTKRHPNLLGVAVAATADAMTRDYRRPTVYSKLLKLDTPLGHRASALLYSIRTGGDEPPTEVSMPRQDQELRRDHVVITESPHDPWWVPSSPEEHREQESPPLPGDGPKLSPAYPGYPVPVAPPVVTGGGRTWDEIRRGMN